jgi:mono/diheme cytochrome c family protein
VTRILVVLLLGALVLGGCEDDSMRRQKKYGTYEPAALFPDDTAAQPLPAGVVAQGDLARAARIATPPPADGRLLARGRARFDVFCSPCHGLSGRGDGMIVQRGFPAPPPYGEARLRAASGRYLFDVITNGYGVMYSYASRVEPEDRWAIVAYIRALQEAEGAKLTDGQPGRERLP